MGAHARVRREPHTVLPRGRHTALPAAGGPRATNPAVAAALSRLRWLVDAHGFFAIRTAEARILAAARSMRAAARWRRRYWRRGSARGEGAESGARTNGGWTRWRQSLEKPITVGACVKRWIADCPGDPRRQDNANVACPLRSGSARRETRRRDARSLFCERRRDQARATACASEETPVSPPRRRGPGVRGVPSPCSPMAALEELRRTTPCGGAPWWEWRGRGPRRVRGAGVQRLQDRSSGRAGSLNEDAHASAL